MSQRSRDAIAPELCKTMPLDKRGRRESRVPAAPAASCGFNGLLRALPGDRAFLPPSSSGYGASLPGWADAPPCDLTPASGRQDHTTSPSATRLRQRVRRPSGQSRRSFSEGGKAPFVCALVIAHELDPPCDHDCAPTLPRPPHPAPRP